MMLLFEGVECVESLSNFLKASRVVLDIFSKTVNVADDVFHFDDDTFEARQVVFNGRIDIGYLLQGLTGAAKGFNGSHAIAVVTIEQSINARERDLDVFGMGKRTLQLLKFFIFTQLRLELVQLLELKAEVVLVALPLCKVLLQFLELTLCLDDLCITLTILGEQVLMTGYGVDDAELEGRILEQEVAMLGMNIEQAKGNHSRAAQMLGISRRTLYRKLDRYAQEGTQT